MTCIGATTVLFHLVISFSYYTLERLQLLYTNLAQLRYHYCFIPFAALSSCLLSSVQLYWLLSNADLDEGNKDLLDKKEESSNRTLP